MNSKAFDLVVNQPPAGFFTAQDQEALEEDVLLGPGRLVGRGPGGTMSIPRAVWEGDFNLFGVTLRCYVLDDEAKTRIINADDVARLFEVMGQEGNVMPSDEEAMRDFMRWQRGVDHG
jgi:hypothetical protein